MLDFAALEKEALEQLNSDLVYAVVMGQQGSGKSRVCGSFPGKTLFLYFGPEKHGPMSAQNGGTKLVPVQVDFDKKQLSPDETYNQLLTILKSHEKIKDGGYSAVVLDGLTELENIIRETKMFKDKCKTTSGAHNNFQESVATTDMFRAVLQELRNLQRTVKCHVAVTCILDVRSLGDQKEVMEASPKLKSYGVAEGLVPQFDDVLVVGRMIDEDTEKPMWNFQMMSNLSKVSKETTGRIKKALNFTPRVSRGQNNKELPEFISADFKNIVSIKKEALKK